MALRRPPTRIELKSDDIDEYETLKNERLMAESDNNDSDGACSGTANADGKRPAVRFPSDVDPKVAVPKKRTAAERIGMVHRGGPGGGPPPPPQPQR